MRASQILRLIFFCGVLSQQPALAASLDNGAPRIISHSKNQFSIYRGDTLSVSVDALGSDLKAKWLRNNAVICRDFRCALDTSDWDLGTQRLTFVVLNDKGSKFIRFRVRVMAPPAGYLNGRVQPQDVTVDLLADDPEPDVKDTPTPSASVAYGEDAPTADDLRIMTMKGRGFSYHRGKLQVIGPAPRVLDWREALKTQAKSYMRFGRQGREMHVLGPKSRVKLLGTTSGRRVLKLLSGSLRSRNLDNNPPRWSLILGDTIQIDTDEMGDILLTREAEGGALLTVLRGQARVFVRRLATGSKKDSEKDSKRDIGMMGEAFTVPQGVAVFIPVHDSAEDTADIDTDEEKSSSEDNEKDNNGVDTDDGEDDDEKSIGPRQNEMASYVYQQPRSRDVSSLIIGSTPEYFSSKGTLQSSSPDSLLKDKLPAEWAKARMLAVQAVEARDYMVAIEALLPYLDKVKGSYEGSLALGMAYKGIFAYGPANKFLKQAELIADIESEPRFQQAEIAMSELKWRKAIELLKAADFRDYPDQQTLHYYRGVAHHRLGEKVAAESSFIQSLWYKDDPEITTSAKAYMATIDSRSWLDLRFAAGIFHDNNIFRLPAKQQSNVPDGVDVNKGIGYVGHAGFTLFPWRRDYGSFGFAFDIEKQGWQNGSLKDYEMINQDFGFEIDLYAGSLNPAQAWIELQLQSKVAMQYIGEERASDSFANTVSLGSPVLWNLNVFIKTVKLLDPLPDRDDGIDDTLGELVDASDRSNGQVYMGAGLRPIDSEDITLKLQGRNGTVKFTDEYVEPDSFVERAMQFDLTYHPSRRGGITLGVGSTTRNFTESFDDRADKELTVGLGWKFHYTPSLYHNVQFDVEKHQSTRDTKEYERRVLGYRLNLNF